MTRATSEATEPGFPLPRSGFGLSQESRCLAERAPVVRARSVVGEPVWLVSGYDDVRSVLADRRISADGHHPDFPHLGLPVQEGDPAPIFRVDGTHHAVLRRLMAEHLSPARCAVLEQDIRLLVDSLIDEWLGRDVRRGDFVRDIALRVPTTVLCWIMGLPASSGEFLNDCANRYMCAGDLTVRSNLRKSFRAMFEMNQYLDAVIERRLLDGATGDDLLGALLAAFADGKLSIRDVRVNLFGLILAGHETTASMISGCAWLLADRDGLTGKLRADPSLISRFIDESLRYLSIVDSFVLRVALEDVEIGGVTIPAGDGVAPQLLSANLDPDRFTRPEEFDLHREERGNVAFGHGSHYCVGSHLARLELSICIESVVERLDGLRLADVDGAVVFRQGSPIAGLESLLVDY